MGEDARKARPAFCFFKFTFSLSAPILNLVRLFRLLKVSSLSILPALTAGLNCQVRLVVPEATEKVVIKDLDSSCLHISCSSSWSNGNEPVAPANIK